MSTNPLSRGRFRPPREIPALLLALLAMAFAAGGVRADDVVFADQTFAETDWVMIPYWVEGLGGHGLFSQQLSGGNPGAFGIVSILLNTAPDGSKDSRYNRFDTFCRFLPAAYDPSSGAILSVDYEEDDYLLSTTGGQGCCPAIRQGEAVFIPFIWVVLEGAWTHRSAAGLVATDFYDPIHPEQHPDFGPTGSPLEFGIYRGNAGWSNDPFTSIAAIDNWQFTLHTEAPTPALAPSWGRLKARMRNR
jgi:hypothetical protein